MDNQFKIILLKTKINFAITVSTLVIAVSGKFTNPAFTNSIFVLAEQLL